MRTKTALIAVSMIMALASIAGAQDKKDRNTHSRGNVDRPSRDSNRTSGSRTSDQRSRDRQNPSRDVPRSDGSGNTVHRDRGGIGGDRSNPFQGSQRTHDSGDTIHRDRGGIGGDRSNPFQGSQRTHDSGDTIHRDRGGIGGDRQTPPRDSGNPLNRDHQAPPRDANNPIHRDRGGVGDGRYNPFQHGSGDRDHTRPSDGFRPERGSVPPISRDHGGQSYHDFDHRGSERPPHFGRPPIHDDFGHWTGGGRGSGGLRIGFYSYSDPYYRGHRFGGRFSYPFYCYDPYETSIVLVASPWYGYSFLPPYIERSRVIVVDDYPSWEWDRWDRYDLDSDRSDTGVRNAVDDLRDAFEEESTRIGDRLVPQDGNVAILNDGKYDYSLNPDDFAKMFEDGIADAKTISYNILEVRRRGDEIRIRARHTFTDSWDKEDSVIHLITLRRERGGDYVIREFGTE